MPAIEVDDLWQSYLVRRIRKRTLKDALGHLGRGRLPRSWALQGVSFTVEAGETLGVIGGNGSGKTTLLRSLAGIFRPTRGSVTVRGRQGSLIDLTAGFQLDLNARDNVFLAGALYGIPKPILTARFEEIVTFAGLEKNVEDPLRTFSSGMALRLGFSLLAAMDPDILLVDEVLAVGDESFKQRCIERVEAMRLEGLTVVFASHELPLVKSMCARVLVLERGQIAYDGAVDGGIEMYCDRLGVDLRTALSHSPLDARVKRMERAWTRRR